MVLQGSIYMETKWSSADISMSFLMHDFAMRLEPAGAVRRESTNISYHAYTGISRHACCLPLQLSAGTIATGLGIPAKAEVAVCDSRIR